MVSDQLKTAYFLVSNVFFQVNRAESFLVNVTKWTELSIGSMKNARMYTHLYPLKSAPPQTLLTTPPPPTSLHPHPLPLTPSTFGHKGKLAVEFGHTAAYVMDRGVVQDSVGSRIRSFGKPVTHSQPRARLVEATPL
jgi:hypothetical protein